MLIKLSIESAAIISLQISVFFLNFASGFSSTSKVNQKPK